LHRILVFGNSGSGKSTLARELAQRHQLAHLDLDILAWLPVVPPERAPLADSNEKIESFTQSNADWVIEGCYADLMDLVSSSATEIIYLKIGVDQCIENAKKRPWEPHKYESEAAQERSLEMLIEWIRQYKDRTDVFSESAHQDFYAKFAGKKTMYTSNDHGDLTDRSKEGK
jgi:adenylate kinase family enzyme